MTLSDSPSPKIGGRCKQLAVIFMGAELESILSHRAALWFVLVRR